MTSSINHIFYCHGFASNFEPSKDKVRSLSALAPVGGITVDYTLSPETVFGTYAQAIDMTNTLIVGTSMGGFFAAWLGCELGAPFLAINPAIAPAMTLRKHIGPGQTHFGTPFELKAAVVEAYADLPFRLDGHGAIALDLGDEVIDAAATADMVANRLPMIVFPGGSHRFDHMPEMIPFLREVFLGGSHPRASPH